MKNFTRIKGIQPTLRHNVLKAKERRLVRFTSRM